MVKLGSVIIIEAINQLGALGEEVIKALDGGKKSWVRGGVSCRFSFES